MTDETFDLSRRKVLGSLGAIGIASAGAGLGTSAYFNDEETFTNNTLTAGDLNLVVDYATASDQGSASSSDEGEIDGNPTEYSYEISDVKPGDSGTLAFCPKVISNSGWVWIGSEDGVSDSGNGWTEPEREVDNSSEGELSEAVQVTVSYAESITRDNKSDEITCNNAREFNNPEDYTLADLSKELESGFLLDGEDVDDGSTDPYPGSTDGDDQQGPCICIEWKVPTDVGNEIQTDSASIDFQFAAVQSRHNADPPNPFVDSTVGTGSGFDYTSIQSAVDAANSGDVISVASGTYSEQVVVDEEVTLVAARGATPTVDGDSNSPVISIEADGVTVDGFEVTNPDQLLGIKVEVGYDDVTICNNRIFDVGPTGELGVSGIIVGRGDHSNIRILNNVVETLRQEITEDSGFPTLNGIIFNDNNADPGTITDVVVAKNTIRDLESDVAPLGIVIHHNVQDLVIENNELSDFRAAHAVDSDDTDDGTSEKTTFAQGLSIDSPSTAGFDIVGNTIEQIESEDGFFAEDIKIEGSADVSGIDIRENNLLSAIGLNNANGANPEVTAENNYWNDSNGPFVIENNDDDGDVPTPGGGSETDLDNVTASAVTENVDFDPFATSTQ